MPLLSPNDSKHFGMCRGEHRTGGRLHKATAQVQMDSSSRDGEHSGHQSALSAGLCCHSVLMTTHASIISQHTN